VDHGKRRHEGVDTGKIPLVPGADDQFLGGDNRDSRIGKRIKLACGTGVLAGYIDHHIGVDQGDHLLMSG
jgi:hypothetical protein